MNFDFSIGTSKNDPSKIFSVARAVQALACNQDLTGPEKEFQQTAPRADLGGLSCSTRSSSSFWAPIASFAPGYGRRDLNVGNASQGGNFVGTDIEPGV